MKLGKASVGCACCLLNLMGIFFSFFFKCQPKDKNEKKKSNIGADLETKKEPLTFCNK